MNKKGGKKEFKRIYRLKKKVGFESREDVRNVRKTLYQVFLWIFSDTLTQT